MTLFHQIRKRNNLSISEMAETIEISLSYCSMLDSGQRKISKDIAFKLKNHFDVPLEESLCAHEIHISKTRAAEDISVKPTGTNG